MNQSKKEFVEYLVSEIIIKSVEKDKLESKIKEIKNKIKIEGFKSVAMNLSISQTAVKGGDLGWLNENEISKKFRSKILNMYALSHYDNVRRSISIKFFNE